MAVDVYDRVGKGRPSLSFYAKRKVHFLKPLDEGNGQFSLLLQEKMIILQTPLRLDIPEAVSHWTVVLEQGGLSLLSSEPLL